MQPTLDASNICLNIRHFFVCSVRALYGRVTLFCKLRNLRFKPGCIATASLRHTCRDSIPSGKAHDFAAVGEHHSITLFCASLDSHLGISAIAAHLGLHRVIFAHL